jgi:hypothetical protein
MPRPANFVLPVLLILTGVLVLVFLYSPPTEISSNPPTMTPTPQIYVYQFMIVEIGTNTGIAGAQVSLKGPSKNVIMGQNVTDGNGMVRISSAIQPHQKIWLKIEGDKHKIYEAEHILIPQLSRIAIHSHP